MSSTTRFSTPLLEQRPVHLTVRSLSDSHRADGNGWPIVRPFFIAPLKPVLSLSPVKEAWGKAQKASRFQMSMPRIDSVLSNRFTSLLPLPHDVSPPPLAVSIPDNAFRGGYGG